MTVVGIKVGCDKTTYLSLAARATLQVLTNSGIGICKKMLSDESNIKIYIYIYIFMNF